MNKHLIEVRYLPATNTRPSRVKLTSGRFGEGHDTVTIGYDHAHNGITDMAEDWLIANGYTVFCKAETVHSYAVLVNEFISLADAKSGKRWKDGIVS